MPPTMLEDCYLRPIGSMMDAIRSIYLSIMSLLGSDTLYEYIAPTPYRRALGEPNEPRDIEANPESVQRHTISASKAMNLYACIGESHVGPDGFPL